MTATSQLIGTEIRVLKLMALGKKSREIAEETGLTLATVKKRREIIIDKTQIHDRAPLAMWAVAKGYLQNPYNNTQ